MLFSAYGAFRTGMESAELDNEGILFPSYFISDTYAPIVKGTFEAARQAVNVALSGADALLAGENSAYSLCRPPGHHASISSMGGYCYFNNAAIAANYLSSRGKVAILDIDFHHGNGTQDIFYDRSDVRYVSMHANPQNMYPYSSGWQDEVGRGDGEGHNYNFPLALSTTNGQYLTALDQAIEKITAHNADYLVLSLGFDTFVDDPIAGLKLTESVYSNIAEKIAAIGLPTLIIQEGGYTTGKLADLMESFLSGFKI